MRNERPDWTCHQLPKSFGAFGLSHLKETRMLTFKDFQRINAVRCEKGFKSSVAEWNPLEWAGALAGEAGELANLCKKIKRGESIPKQDLADEIADVFTYLDLLATRLDIDMQEAIRAKFNAVSRKRGVPEIVV